MSKDFTLYCSARSYHAGSPGYREPLGKEQACVFDDSTRYVYSAPPAATQAEFRQSMRGFGEWARRVFAKPGRGKRLTGRFPTYHVE